MVLGYTGGTFDIPHAGHFAFLRQCRKFCDELVVSLNTDEFVKQYKGNNPLYSYKERELLIQVSGSVSRVIPNVGGADSKPAILSVNPEIIFIGTDWLVKDYCKQMGFTKKWLEDHAIGLCYLPYTRLISSTDIKNRCAKQL